MDHEGHEKGRKHEGPSSREGIGNLGRLDADDVVTADDELASLLEAIYLLESPRNAERLLAALADAYEGKGERLSLEELAREVGLGGEN